MLYFTNDYSEGAHPKVLEALTVTNMEPLDGYGMDKYSLSAIEKIKKACQNDKAEVYFLTGGTQTNMVVISSLLDTFEGVIAANTGHISVHEAGAIEYHGHKVMPIPHHNGKLMAADVKAYLETFYGDANHDHMVFPGMAYISHPTEYGTLYTKEELTALSEVCHQYNLPLFLDGARLGYGLTANDTDVTLPVIAELTDVFYIGGTKVGALCGEAVVFTKKTPSHFVTRIKQHGALLAKGRLNGVQFDALFTDDLYLTIARHANKMAQKLLQGMVAKGYTPYIDSPTNQQFFIFENDVLNDLKEKVVYSFWERYGDSHTVIRLATSWATREEDIEALMKLIPTRG